MQNVSWHHPTEISRDIPKKMLSRWRHMLLQNLSIPFSINGTFTGVTVSQDTMVSNTPSYHHRCWPLNLCWQQFGWSFSSLAIYLKRGHVRPHHTSPLSISPPQMISIFFFVPFFPSHLFPLPQTFLNCVAGIKFRLSVYLQKNI